MILPFVREVLADVEKSSGFQQAGPYLKQRRGESTPPAGRIRLSGLVPTAKALLIPFLQRVAAAPLIVVVANNRAAEALHPVVQAFCDLTGACHPEAVVKLPAHDVLPFENLSPHPEIQEERATTLWKIVTGAASIVITPVEATAMRLQPAEHYAGLARVVRRNDSLDVDELVQHLNTVGYTAVDVVEMPGQYAVRGGLLDAYPPEADRPLRIELFGDDVESIRKFDPGTQRSAAPVDEVILLPLTETPVREEVLTGVHARLSGARIQGGVETVREALASTGLAVFPGWEFYANAEAPRILFDLLPDALVFTDEPADIRTEHERWWEKVIRRHELSGVGNLARPEQIYLAPEEWEKRLKELPGGELVHLGLETSSQPRIHANERESQELEEDQRQNFFEDTGGGGMRHELLSSCRNPQCGFTGRFRLWSKRSTNLQQRAGGSSLLRRIPARWSGWPTSLLNTRCRFVWAAVRLCRAVKPISTKPLILPVT